MTQASLWLSWDLRSGEDSDVVQLETPLIQLVIGCETHLPLSPLCPHCHPVLHQMSAVPLLTGPLITVTSVSLRLL